MDRLGSVNRDISGSIYNRDMGREYIFLIR